MNARLYMSGHTHTVCTPASDDLNETNPEMKLFEYVWKTCSTGEKNGVAVGLFLC